MTDRQTKVSLALQFQQYVDGMNKAAKATRETTDEGKKLAQLQQDFDRLGRGMVTAGGLVAVGLGVAAAKFTEFDAAMSNVQAATHESAENMELLSQAAIEAGASTVYSATEAAGAIEELAKAGISTTDILQGGLAGALDLAAAGGLDVAEAAGIAATTMQQFGLDGDKAAHVADLLAAGAGKAMGDVSDMGMALKQSGLVADQFGISVEETTGALAAFASKGLLGSDAGTSFKTMLLALAKPSGQAADLMEELGIQAYDASGRFVGLAGLAGELQDGLAGLTEEQRQSALATIFGTDAIRSATVLYEEGAKGIEEWTSKVDDAGYASETAATRLDNLKGDIEALQGAVDSAFISMGSAADGPLRGFIQALTVLVDKFNEMPEAGKQAAFWVGAVGAAGATALGSYLLLVPKVAEFNAAMEVLGPNVQRANRAIQGMARIGGIAAVVGTAAIGVDYLAEEIAKQLLPSAEQVDNKFRSARTGVQLFAAALTKEGISNTREAGDLLSNLGNELDAVADSDFWHPASISGTAVTVIKQIAETAKTDLPEAQAQFRQLAEDGELTDRQLRTMIKTVPELQNALLGYADTTEGAADAQALLEIALGDSEDSTKANEDALRKLSGQAAQTGDDIDGLADQIRNFGSATLDVREAQRQFEQATDDVSAAVQRQKDEFIKPQEDAYREANGTLDGFVASLEGFVPTLDTTTQAGRDNQAALDDLVDSTLEYAASIQEQTGDQEKSTAALEEGRKRLIDMLGQFGITGQAAEDYADDLGLIPENVDTYVSLNTKDAQDALNNFVRSNDGRTISLIVDGESGRRVSGSGVIARAGGGAVYGPGTSTSDSIPAVLSTGEHVLTAADVDAMGGQHNVYAFRESLHSGGGGGFGGSSPVINQVIQPAPGMSEEQVGRIAAEKMNFALRSA